MKDYNYSRFAKYYDIVELRALKSYGNINNFLDKLFKKNKVKSVLDITCGTGAQVISLAKKGYDVTASDLCKEMLDIAKEKAKKNKLNIRFHQGDIRTAKYGKFDAVIAIFNSIGHLNKKDFEKAIRTVSNNLKEEGLFIFDIFNLDFMKSGGFRHHEYIDIAMEHKGKKYVRFNKNKIDFKKGIIKINQQVCIQEGFDKPIKFKEDWDYQIYSSDELKKLLEKNGFKVLEFFDHKIKKFDKKKSVSIYTVARKIK